MPTTEETVLTSSLRDAHDIVLLDRMLPTMNGLLVLQKRDRAGISTLVLYRSPPSANFMTGSKGWMPVQTITL